MNSEWEDGKRPENTKNMVQQIVCSTPHHLRCLAGSTFPRSISGTMWMRGERWLSLTFSGWAFSIFHSACGLMKMIMMTLEASCGNAGATRAWKWATSWWGRGIWTWHEQLINFNHIGFVGRVASATLINIWNIFYFKLKLAWFRIESEHSK